ncbi:MAG: glycosyltransferase [Rhodobacteraceae bacterium]|nr:MAG: glycosyltransferase [Paracoccaceae bacterium]
MRWPPRAGTGVSHTAPLGARLVALGEASAAQIGAALSAQRLSGARLGSVLVANGAATPRAVAEAAAAQARKAFADLEAEPLEPALAVLDDLPVYLRRRIAPWRVEAGRTIFAATDLDAARLGLAELRDPPPDADIALCAPEAMERALVEAFGPALAARAAARPPATVSARSPTTVLQRAGFVGLVIAAITAFALSPGGAGAALFAALVLINAGNAAVRIAVLGAALRRPRDPVGAADVAVLADQRPPPTVTLLIALLREPETAALLIEAIERLDWPRERLDVKLILEADDHATRAALEAADPPPCCRILIAPPGGPRTKPRALNFALDFAEGEIVGVYDAEDRPEPDQIRRVVRILAESPPEVACVQARLNFYNPRENWLTRCFALEYAIWFDMLIAGFRDLRLPIPLGGTSVFFRRDVLEEVGAWDAHNVTEDADLGMRLARAGYRCEVSASTTHEEANSRLGAWIMQRSRWLKGYMTTWLVHMRRPAALWRDLGPRGFIGFQTLFLGAIVAYFGLPVFWTVWALSLAGMGPAWFEALPLWAFAALAVVQLSGWIAMILAAIIATARRGQAWLTPWIPTLAFYWPIGALAGYLALAEMLLAPTFWRKTRHGVGRSAAAAGREANAARAARRTIAVAAAE